MLRWRVYLDGMEGFGAFDGGTEALGRRKVRDEETGRAHGGGVLKGVDPGQVGAGGTRGGGSGSGTASSIMRLP